MSQTSRHSGEVPDGLVTDYAIAGDPEACQTQLRRLLENDLVRSIGFIPMGVDRVDVARKFMRQVIGPVLSR
jgi:alkanesulfonate monooxygenase SsuD/methylene tetrahydromethanopterin reductase-like flavin-dependent oxidoreductase (luciferase family)